MNKDGLVESILFAANKAISVQELADFLQIKSEEVEQILKRLQDKLNTAASGVHILSNNRKIQMATNPAHGKALHKYFETELSGELSKPSLETLTIIAYRQPISKEELEQIRGVNCSLIIRNLLIRGLVDYQQGKSDLVPMYSVTMDFLRHLGVDSVEDLPDFDKLNSDENLQVLLETVNTDGQSKEN